MGLYDVRTMERDYSSGDSIRRVYEKPMIRKVFEMTFPFDIVAASSGQVVCGQCSGCHGCR
ncbi:MAG: hypothetical protein KJ592_03540 [Nanoarchaeota archaeon]|nr:hypothetical protein [Nanoarchaeota archaeon]